MIFAPLLALAGAAAGLLRDRGPLVSTGAAVGVGLLFAVSIEGVTAVLATIPALLWGGTLYLPAERLGWLSRVPTLLEDVSPAAGLTASEVALRRRRETDTQEVLSSLSDALSSLSAAFYALSDRLASPGADTLRRLCEESLRRHCRTCRQNAVCYGEAYDETADMINKLASLAASTGRCEIDRLPKEMKERCPFLPETASAIRHGYAKLLEDASRQNKTEIFAFDYEAIAALLSAAAERSAERYRVNEAMTARVERAAEAMRLPAAHIAVFGDRRKTLLAGGRDLTRTPLSADEIIARFRQDCGLSLTVPEFRTENGFVTMTAFSAPVLSCESAKATRRKEKETVNGDSAVTFDNREQYFYSLISDGMGSGADAAMTSRVTCLFLQKLLGAGNRKDIVLKMLNHFIRSKNLECFTTVDLLEIDLLSGDASFVKSGAAPS